MPSYKTSNGERVQKSVIDARVKKAKADKLEQQQDEHGYNFCEDCKCNGSNTYLDCSHDISVDQCQKTGRTELAWSVDNITIRCRACHRKHDFLN